MTTDLRSRLRDQLIESYRPQNVPDAECLFCGASDRPVSLHAVRYYQDNRHLPLPPRLHKWDTVVSYVKGSLPVCTDCAPPCTRCGFAVLSEEHLDKIAAFRATYGKGLAVGPGRCEHPPWARLPLILVKRLLGRGRFARKIAPLTISRTRHDGSLVGTAVDDERWDEIGLEEIPERPVRPLRTYALNAKGERAGGVEFTPDGDSVVISEGHVDVATTMLCIFQIAWDVLSEHDRATVLRAIKLSPHTQEKECREQFAILMLHCMAEAKRTKPELPRDVSRAISALPHLDWPRLPSPLTDELRGVFLRVLTRARNRQ